MTAAGVCSCGASLEDARYAGPQETDVAGEYHLLGNCAECRSTRVLDTVQDASYCCACQHLVLGDFEDPKVIVCQGEAVPRVYCADCAPEIPMDDVAIANARAMLAFMGRGGHVRVPMLTEETIGG